MPSADFDGSANPSKKPDYQRSPLISTEPSLLGPREGPAVYHPPTGPTAYSRFVVFDAARTPKRVSRLSAELYVCKRNACIPISFQNLFCLHVYAQISRVTKNTILLRSKVVTSSANRQSYGVRSNAPGTPTRGHHKRGRRLQWMSFGLPGVRYVHQRDRTHLVHRYWL